MHLSLPLLLAAAANVASLTVRNPSQDHHGRDECLKAAYFLVNDPSGNSLASLHVGSDGKLSSLVKTATHGKGLIGNTATGPSLGDSLFDADSVKVSGNYIFVVNPGSNTLSMFTIPPYDPWHPVLVGSPAYTKGEFPVSVTYSDKLETACVFNAGAKAGVACFSVSPTHGLTSLDAVARPVPVLHQTTPPVGPPSTGSDIQFNPSSTGLFITVKGNPGTTPPTPGTIYTWPVVNGKVGTESTAHTIPSLLVAFSATFLGQDSKLLVTDAAYGAAIISVGPGPSFALSLAAHVAVPNQVAICWGAYSPAFDAAYLPDAGSPKITIVSPETGKIRGAIAVDAAALGLLDVAVQEKWLYLRAGDGSVVVVDQKAGKEVQKFDTGLAGPGRALVGMALWPADL